MLNSEVMRSMADPTKKGAPKEPPPETGEDFALDEITEKLEAELAKVPKKTLKKAEAEVQEFLEGDLKWADLTSWSPEKLHEAAKAGYHLYESNQYDKAEVIFKGLTVLDTENFYYHQMLGACFQQTKKPPEAIVEYSIAVDLNPDDLTSLTNRGEVYYELQLWDLAEQDFEAAIALDPKAQDRWANRARILKKKVTGLRKTGGTGAQAAPEKKKAKAGEKK